MAVIVGDDLVGPEPSHTVGVGSTSRCAGSIDASGILWILLSLRYIIVVYSDITAIDMNPCLLSLDDPIGFDLYFTSSTRHHDTFPTELMYIVTRDSNIVEISDRYTYGIILIRDIVVFNLDIIRRDHDILGLDICPVIDSPGRRRSTLGYINCTS